MNTVLQQHFPQGFLQKQGHLLGLPRLSTASWDSVTSKAEGKASKPLGREAHQMQH
jgi:hypothetical protein